MKNVLLFLAITLCFISSCTEEGYEPDFDPEYADSSGVYTDTRDGKSKPHPGALFS